MYNVLSDTEYDTERQMYTAILCNVEYNDTKILREEWM